MTKYKGRSYNIEEAQLQSWKKILLSVDSKRQALKEELLNIIDTSGNAAWRLERFNRRRRELLHSQHGQGWTWSPFLPWLVKLIHFFLPASWKKGLTGSRLRQALETAPTLPSFSLLTKEALSPEIVAHRLDDPLYEQALFEAPKKALLDLQARINSEETSNDDLELILSRLDALKYRLSPDCYQAFLACLYQQHSLQSLSHYYSHYLKASEEAPSMHDVIECHMIAKALVDWLIKPYPASPLNPRLYALQKLLVLIATEGRSNVLSLRNLLTQASTEKCASTALLAQLELLYKGDKLSEQIKKDFACKETLDSPLRLLKWVLDNSPRLSFAKQRPLMVSVTQLAYEELLKLRKDRLKVKGYFHESTLLICTQILENGPEFCKKNQSHSSSHFDYLDVCESLLNPCNYYVGMPLDYRKPSYDAMRVLISYLFAGGFETKGESEAKQKALTQGLATTRVFAQHYHPNAENPLQSEQVNWLLYSLARTSPELAEAVEPLLRIKTYSLQEVQVLTNKTSLLPTQKLIRMMLDRLTEVEQAHFTLNCEEENQALAPLVLTIEQLLNKKYLEFEQLDSLQHAFDTLRPYYLTEELSKHWQSRLDKHWQQTIICKDVNELILPKIKIPEKALLTRINDLCLAANKQAAKNELSKEAHLSRLALRHFFLYLQLPSLQNLGEGCDLLSRQLKRYLSPSLYQSWDERLTDIKRQDRAPLYLYALAANQERFFSKRQTDCSSLFLVDEAKTEYPQDNKGHYL